MTKITCINDRGQYTIDIDGHAGYNPGMDIVCSACSVLSYTLANVLENQEAELRHIKIDDGVIHIDIKPLTSNQEIISTIITTIMTGYEMLAEQYPDNVAVEW